VPARAKVFEYSGALGRDGRAFDAAGSPLEIPASWTPEHLLLAAVARCTLKSLGFHARGALRSAAANMSSSVTRTEPDGRYAVVALAVDFDIELDPEPEGEALGQLLARAERDCFVGNSLTAKPRYAWRVNGRPAAAAASTP
jgi:organic hydroperoxide reductase OsmC/OhrA